MSADGFDRAKLKEDITDAIDRWHEVGIFDRGAIFAGVMEAVDAALPALAADPMTKLAEMIADLQGHIEQRALDIAEPRINEAYVVAQTEVEVAEAKARAEKQRSDGLVAELRRQIDIQVRRAERNEAELKRIVAEIEAERDKTRDAEGATLRDENVINGTVNGLGIALKIVRGER